MLAAVDQGLQLMLAAVDQGLFLQLMLAAVDQGLCSSCYRRWIRGFAVDVGTLDRGLCS
jgi:hypothetical protein